MRRLKTMLGEIWGLFVDDGRFALAIVLWLALVLGAMLKAAGILKAAQAGAWVGPVLFAGLAAILAESVLRAARRCRK